MSLVRSFKKFIFSYDIQSQDYTKIQELIKALNATEVTTHIYKCQYSSEIKLYEYLRTNLEMKDSIIIAPFNETNFKNFNQNL